LFKDTVFFHIHQILPSSSKSERKIYHYFINTTSVFVYKYFESLFYYTESLSFIRNENVAKKC